MWHLRMNSYLEFYVDHHRIKQSLSWMNPNECRRSKGLAAYEELTEGLAVVPTIAIRGERNFTLPDRRRYA